MHTIDLSKYSIRTDLIIDEISDINLSKITNYSNNVKLEELEVTDNNKKLFNKKNGYYKTISFEDITDKDNYKEVESVFIETLKKLLKELKIKDDNSVLIIGLGNDKSTPDSLGPKVVDNILVTNHLFKLGEVEKGYRRTASFKPNVTGSTGLETKDIIVSLINTTKPDFLIVIDALASSSIDRVNKTIQISSSGINPGSGVGNNREELSYKTLNIPVIAIGVPTVVDASTIVNDTFNYMYKQLSYKIDNINNNKLKLVPNSHQNYKEHKNTLSQEEKENLLGYIGTLDQEEFKRLIYEVLIPINSNLIVTPKEIDFIIDKISLLISQGINKTLHKNYNSTI